MSVGAQLRAAAGAVAIAVIAAVPAPSSAQRSGLTAAPQLARVYDAIFDARFDEVPALVAQTCADPARGPVDSPRSLRAAAAAPAPRPEVCQLLEVQSVWWQIQLDPEDRSRDADFRARADATVTAMTDWTTREPETAEAWFYLGGAYGARAQWRVLRGERIAAARDGKRIKEALERALALDPGLQDAYFGIGLYHYYADVAPTAARMLRWLLLLPGGDRAEGLREMLRARDGGQLLRSEADYQLHIIYLWYEKQPERALELLRMLRDRHPKNPHFPQLIAQVEDVYLHDLTASLRSWEALLEAARARRVELPLLAETHARLGAARQLDRLFETDAALPHLRAVVEARSPLPFGAMARAQLQLGQALDRLGYRTDAVAAYRAALAAIPAGDPDDVAGAARRGLRDAPDPATTSAYRLSLEGWRALERGATAEAARFLSQSRAIRPQDPVTRYRRARLLVAQKNEPAALVMFEGLVASRDATPPTVYASACVEAARLHERQGDEARALELYRTASTVFGADRRTKDAAERAAARLDAVTRTLP